MKRIGKFQTRLTQILAILLVSMGAQGSDCGSSPDALADTQQLAAKMVAHLGRHASQEIKDLAVNQIPLKAVLDNRFHKVDRTKKGLETVDSVGILTANTFKNEFQAYGSAVLLSPCHVLTNRHVVRALAQKNGFSRIKGSRMYFSVGQAKACNSADAFQEMSIEAKVVAFGAGEIGRTSCPELPAGADCNEEHAKDDWAILELDRSVKTPIQFPRIDEEPIMGGDIGIRAGFPWSEVKEGSGFKNVRAQYVKSIGAMPDGVVMLENKTMYPGMSGGAVFRVDTENGKTDLYLTGIDVGGGGTLSYREIKSQLISSGQGSLLRECK